MKILSILLTSLWLMVIHSSCEVFKKGDRLKKFEYEKFKASVLPAPSLSADSANVFDLTDFTDDNDSLYLLVRRIDTMWKSDLAELKKIRPADKAEKKMIRAEESVISRNIQNLSSLLTNKSSSAKPNCREMECPLVAEVVKSKQLMYLYVGGELKDSFAVSTGVSGRDTPDMNVKPTGPVFIKYTSTRYPEGDYKGLGNMPYAVFVKGGYAIHGTTPGNFAKLGKRASHGCIRLHPDNAKLFFELVKLVGLSHTWVIVR